MASSLETNKLIAAILTAGVIASGTGVLSRMLYHAETPEETAYVIAVAEEGEGEGAGEAAATPLGVLLANADAAAGESEVKACAACHSFEEGGPVKVGPPLHGVVGREIAAVGDFAYSDALAGMDGAWDYEALSGFLEDPKGWAPGTKMAYAGIKKEEDRADVIMYLRSISPDAPPLPEPEEVQAAEAEGGEAAAEGGGAGGGVLAMIADADPAAGESATRACAACHSFEEGGPNKIGPALHGVVGREIAAVEDFAYSDALAGMDGTWDYEALSSFLADPKGWAPGTKMAYAGVKQEQQLAELIAYLRSISPDAPPLPEGGGAAAEQTEGGTEAQAETEQQAGATGEQAQGDQQQAATGETEPAPSDQQQAAEAEPEEGADQQQAGATGEQAQGDQQQAATGETEPSDRQQATEAEPAPSEQQQAAAEQEPADQQQDAADDQAAGGGAMVAMIADADPAAGETSAKRKCAVCHSFEEGGPNKVGPNLHGVVGSDIASAEGFKYSGALADKEGSWDYESLDAFLADPRGWAQGTRMAFAGLKDEQERAEVISYLRSISPDAPALEQ